MDRRTLGKSDLVLPRAGFGCSRIGGSVSGGDTKGALRILHRAFDAGINFFDTANIYGQGRSEKLLARAFAGRRSQVVLATKGGYQFSAAAGWLAKLKPLARKLIRLRPQLLKSAQKIRASQIKQDFSRASLLQALDGSLRRLKTDYIDLYQLHSPPLETLRSGEVFETLEEMKKSGRVRHSGIACLEPEHARLCPGHGLAAVQLELNFVNPGSLASLVPEAQTAGVGVIARQPFASGRLLREPGDLTAEDFGGDAQAALEARQRLGELRKLGPLPELSIRYLTQRQGIDCVLFGTTRLEHLEKNLAALEAPPLTREEMSAVDSIVLGKAVTNVH